MAAARLSALLQACPSSTGSAAQAASYTPSTRAHIHAIDASGPSAGAGCPRRHNMAASMGSLAATRLTANAEALAAFYETRRSPAARGRPRRTRAAPAEIRPAAALGGASAVLFGALPRGAVPRAAR